MARASQVTQAAAVLCCLLACLGGSGRGPLAAALEQTSDGDLVDDRRFKVTEGENKFEEVDTNAKANDDDEDDFRNRLRDGGDDDEDDDEKPIQSGLTGRALVSEGQVQRGFSCRQAEKLLMADGADVDVRRLQFALLKEDDFLGQLNDVAALASSSSIQQEDVNADLFDEDYEASRKEDLILYDARLQVIDAGDAQGQASNLLEARVDGGPEFRLSEDGIKVVTILYNCFGQGEAVVETRFAVREAEGRSLGDVCLRWRKKCAWGWHDLEIAHEDSVGHEGSVAVVESGVLQQEWSSKMLTQGTWEEVTRFRVISNGVLRLRPPILFADNPVVLDVDIRGPAIGGDTFEVTEFAQSVTVIYHCHREGRSDVMLWLEQDRWDVDGIGGGQRMEVRWTKRCPPVTAEKGSAALKDRDMQVVLFSDTWQNQTLAVADGKPLPGFERVCRGRGASRKTAGSCSQTPPALALPRRDKTTRIEFRLGAAELGDVAFSPPPDLAYDKKVLVATVTQWPRRVKADDPSVLYMNVRYICFTNGVSNITLTIHMPGYKPLDVAWRKKCRQPVAHQSQAITAPQALSAAMFSLIGFGAFCLLVGRKFFSSKGSSAAVQKDVAAGGDAENAGVASKVGKPQGGRKELVTFH